MVLVHLFLWAKKSKVVLKNPSNLDYCTEGANGEFSPNVLPSVPKTKRLVEISPKWNVQYILKCTVLVNEVVQGMLQNGTFWAK